MIYVVVTNRVSDLWDHNGVVNKTDWDSGKYWVPVYIKNKVMLMARNFLREI